MQLSYTINTIYAGKIGDAAVLAGLGLGTALLESMTLFVIIGMNGACETLTAQAFGANQLRLCGVYLNRARIINTLMFIPLALILCFTKQILRGLGQEEAVIAHAHEYVLLCLPGAYMLSMFDLTKRFLNCLKFSWVPMIAQVSATLLHIFWCNLFVVQLGWGLKGLGMASTITSFLIIASTELYARCLPSIEDAFFWPDLTAFHGWKEYFSLGLPTTLIIQAEIQAW